MTVPTDQSSRWRLGPLTRTTLQLLGFALGLALLFWCINIALKKENREHLAQLQAATPAQIAAMVGLSLIVLAASGAVFRETLRPIRKLPMLEVQAVNAIASLLALLPFKMSVLFRALIHNRRDRVPLLTIGAWFAAVAVVILCILLPVLGASLWRHSADPLWFLTAIGGSFAALLSVLLIARRFSTENGWTWFKSHFNRLPLPRRLRPGTPAHHALFEKAHEGVRMLASPRVVLGCALLRTLDIAAQSARIALTAAIVGHPLPWEHALLAGSIFFLISAAAPTGQIGVLEAGTATLVSAVLPNVNLEQFALIVLTVSGTQAAVLLLASMLGLAYLRPDRFLRLGGKPQT